MTNAEAFLAYHCPTLRADYFKRPCEGQVAVAKNRRQASPHAVMPYGLEQCLKCQGKDLVIREAAAMEYTGDIRPEMTRGILDIGESWTVQEDENMPAVAFKNEAETPEAPRCPKHPTEPQVQCGQGSKRAGQNLGACLLCMADRRLGRKPIAAKDKMTPAVARDLGLKPPEPVHQMPHAMPDISVQPGAPTDTPGPSCKNHPDRAAKIDALGRNMALCQECISARGRKSGLLNHAKGLTSPPVSIPLNQAKYAEVKEWLEEQALENERTLMQEIMYRLKLAMREASP